MYVEKKRISGKEYYYLKKSARRDNKVSTQTVAYLGKAPMSKKQIEKKIKDFDNKSRLKSINKKYVDPKDLVNISELSVLIDLYSSSLELGCVASDQNTKVSS